MTELSGLFGDPLKNLKNLLADVEAFHTFLGLEEEQGAEEAKGSIFVLEKTADSSLTYPFALVTYQQGDWGASRDSEGGGIHAFSIDSSMTLLIEDELEEITQDNIFSFLNEIGLIIQGMLEKSGTVSYLRIKNIQNLGWEVNPSLIDDEDGDVSTTPLPTITAAFRIDWGE